MMKQPTDRTTAKRAGRPRLSETSGQVSTREKILEAATRLFVQKGYMAVSIKEITQQVCVTKPTLYHYFKDKDNLFTLVLINMMEQAHMRILAAISGPSSVQGKLEGLAHCFFESQCCLSYLLKDAIDYTSPPHCEVIRDTMARHMLTPLAEMFADEIAQGTLKANDPTLMAETALSMLDGIRIQTLLKGQMPDERTSRTYAQTLLYGYAAPVSADHGSSRHN